MNYKKKWLFNLLIFPLVTLTPMFIYFIIQSSLGDGIQILPTTTSFTPWIFLFYIPIFFIVMTWFYSEINGYKKIKLTFYFLIFLFSLGEAFIAFSMYFVIAIFGKASSPQIFEIIILLLAGSILGTSLFAFYFKIIGSILSFKGPTSYSIHRIAYSLVPTTLFKRWNIEIDNFQKISNNHYENYSFLWTNKAIYILDFIETESTLPISFVYEKIILEEGEVNFPSLMIDKNFDFATKEIVSNSTEVIDIFDSLDEAIINFPKINFAPPSIEKIKTTKKYDESDYIKNVLFKREHFINTLKINQIKFNMNDSDIDDLPIINVLIFEDEDKKIEGNNENFIITNRINFLNSVKELEKLLPNKTSTINKIRKNL